VEGNGALGNGVTCLDESRQVFVFDRDQLGRVLSDVLRLRHDQCDRLAHEAHATMREPGAERHPKRAAANSFEERGRRGSLPAGGNEIGPGQDVEDTGDILRLLDVDANDFGVRPVGAEKMSRNLITELVIGCVTAPARDQSQVFPAASKLMFGQFPSQQLSDSSSRTARAPRCRSVTACDPDALYPKTCFRAKRNAVCA
jgi:hypothetical protein